MVAASKALNQKSLDFRFDTRERPSCAVKRNTSSMLAARLGVHVPEQRPGRVGEVAQAHRQLPDARKDRLRVIRT